MGMRGCVGRGVVAAAWIGLASSFAAPGSARSEEAAAQPAVKEGPDSYPTLSGELSIEIQDDRAYHSQDGDRELNDLFTKTEPAFSLAFTESFSLEAALTFEPVEDPEPSESREFDKEGLFVEQLFAKWSSDKLELYAGK